MNPTNSSEIRQAFLDFFEEMGHQVVASSPLPLFDNPTLLFTNAGMNQFVDAFLGREKRPYVRAASSQKCMRVQGKHNDLENVGPSPRHHTFFEMLGNFSFGDYFKEDAIRYAYDFLVTVCQIPEERLWYTVHVDDDQAYDIWANDIAVDADRIVRMGDKTNFWMMGDVGPCGPTSEIHYDWGPDHCTCDEPNCSVLLDNDCGRWLEVWNLVFMQFNQSEDGSRTPLPRPGVDTGMGLERITAVVENRPINYETDLFEPAMYKVAELLGDSDVERQENETGYRVIADHGRAATFLIADGVLPGNVGRGYVLRMIIRRAARFGREIGFVEPFLAQIAREYIDLMGDFYSELHRNEDHILKTITLEEKRFAKTLDTALTHLELVLTELHHEHRFEIPGNLVFDLYATHGLPLEITRDVANERGFTIDEAGFLSARQAHIEASGAGAFGRYSTSDNVYSEFLSSQISHGNLSEGGVDYDPYSGSRMEADILGILVDNSWEQEAAEGSEIELVTTATPFYVEAGGEVSDTGRILVSETGAEIAVTKMILPVAGLIVHVGQIRKGHIAVGQLVELKVDNDRRWDIRRNHTATHILHRELRLKLGRHVTQQGSLVAPERLRFDFSHDQAVDDNELASIERSINEAILANYQVMPEYMPRKKAIGEGAVALFGEKYGDVVRTIKVGAGSTPYSFELCGGLHVSATGDIGLFQFVSEQAVGAGVRRVEAVTGFGALSLVQERANILVRLNLLLKSPMSEMEARLESILAENRTIQRELAMLRQKRTLDQFSELLSAMQSVNGHSVLAEQVEADSFDSLREMADWFRDKVPSGVAVFGAIKDDQPILVATVTDDLVDRGVSAGKLVGQLAGIVGGGGGGRPKIAQAGGKDASKLPEALRAVPGFVRDALASSK